MQYVVFYYDVPSRLALDDILAPTYHYAHIYMFNIFINDVPIFKTQTLYISELRNQQKKTTHIYESE